MTSGPEGSGMLAWVEPAAAGNVPAAGIESVGAVVRGGGLCRPRWISWETRPLGILARDLPVIVRERVATNCPSVDAHLRADADTGEGVWLELADVLIGYSAHAQQARQRTARLLQRYPGSAVAAVSSSATGCTLAIRDGTVIKAAATCATARLWPSTCASIMYVLLCAGLPLTALHQAMATAGRVDNTAPAEATGFPCVQQARLWLP